MLSPSSTAAMDLESLLQGLPLELRRVVLKQAYKGMTIDQRRAAGILPGRLVVPRHLARSLEKWLSRIIIASGRLGGVVFCPLMSSGKMEYYLLRIVQEGTSGRTDRYCSYIDPDTHERARFHW